MVSQAFGLKDPKAVLPRPALDPSSWARTIFTAHIVKSVFIIWAAFLSGLRPPKDSEGT